MFVLKNLRKGAAKDLPDIKICQAENKKKIIIGRNEESKIVSSSVSREHLLIKPNFEQRFLLIKFLGKSPAALNGFVLDKDEAYECRSNDIIQLVINSDFEYRVTFESDKNTLSKRSMDEKDDSKFKRQKSDENFDKWVSIDDKCLVFSSKDCFGSEKIAAYDLDQTLIRTMSGNVFPKSIDDWQLNMSDVPKKLKRLFENGFKIVIFTNQAGIESNRLTIADVKKKMQMIHQRLDVPLQIFIATGSTIFRKPRTGMWQLLQEKFNNGIQIDMTTSFFVGDACGRPENKVLKKKKDHSSADRLFALNLDLNFYTPEEHFLNYKKQNNQFSKPEYNPRSLTASKLVEDDKSLTSNEQEMIVLVGFPASGKTQICSKYLKKAGYEIVNRDTLNSMQKCLVQVEEALKGKKSCVIDNTNPDPSSRQKFIDIAKKLGVKVRCFLMTTTYHHSKHNNLFRELTDSSHQKINEVVFNTYKNKFVEPTLREGFHEIVKINCVPKFDQNSEHEKLYHMYLLER